jgi:hypothetical protein
VSSMGQNGVTGIIIPLESHITDRVFHHRPIIPLFVDRFPSDLSVGDTAFFYEKGGGRVLEGEGSIAAISMESADEARRYGKELCLSPEELDGYVSASGKRSSDRMLILKIEDAVKYARALKCSVPVGRGGEYLTQGVFSKILSENG